MIKFKISNIISVDSIELYLETIAVNILSIDEIFNCIFFDSSECWIPGNTAAYNNIGSILYTAFDSIIPYFLWRIISITSIMISKKVEVYFA